MSDITEVDKTLNAILRLMDMPDYDLHSYGNQPECLPQIIYVPIPSVMYNQPATLIRRVQSDFHKAVTDINDKIELLQAAQSDMSNKVTDVSIAQSYISNKVTDVSIKVNEVHAVQTGNIHQFINNEKAPAKPTEKQKLKAKADAKLLEDELKIELLRNNGIRKSLSKL